MLYPTCEVYDISTILKVDYSFILIIGVLGLYVWKPGLKSFIDNSSAWVKCGGFFTDYNEEGEGGKPSFDKKKILCCKQNSFLQWQNVLHDMLSVVYETKV